VIQLAVVVAGVIADIGVRNNIVGNSMVRVLLVHSILAQGLAQGLAENDFQMRSEQGLDEEALEEFQLLRGRGHLH